MAKTTSSDLTRMLRNYGDALRDHAQSANALSQLTSQRQWWHAELWGGTLGDGWGEQDLRIANETLYRRYTKFCADHDLHIDSISIWGQGLSGLGLRKIRPHVRGCRVQSRIIPPLGIARAKFEQRVGHRFVWPGSMT